MTLTYDNRSAAYDLNLFKDSAAEKLPKKKTEKNKKRRLTNGKGFSNIYKLSAREHSSAG